MAITDGSILTAADFNLMPRGFATTTARDDYYTANPSLLVAGACCIVGSSSTMAEYIHDGTGWRGPTLIDTGWMTVTPAAGFIGSASPAVRVRNGIAYFRGAISGAMGSTAQTIGTVNALARPVMEDLTYRVAFNNNDNTKPCHVWVTTSGDIIAWPWAAGTHAVALSALSGYSVD